MTYSTHTLKARQIKAARALLDWSQDDLAQASSLSVATIRKIELGEISPRASTNDAIRIALEAAGLEFVEPDGVRHKPEGVTVYQGKQGLIAFFQDVHQTALKKGGEFVQVLASEVPFAEILEDYHAVYLENMLKIKNAFRFRCILTDDTSMTPGDGYCEYRTISKGYVDSVPFYVYDNKFAIIVFDTLPNPKITIIESQSVANAFRRQFESMWEKATPLR